MRGNGYLGASGLKSTVTVVFSGYDIL